jgi:hypothetical protein
LEKANVTHLQKFSDMAKKSEALEKVSTTHQAGADA